MYIGVFLIQRASFIHLVCRCAFLSTTFALSQSTTWFSSTAGSVITDFWVTLLSLALEARGLCTSCERVTKVWLSCHMWKDWARPLQEFWKLMASPQLTVLTERYGTLWFIRRTKSRMKRRPNWSIVSLARFLARTALAHTLGETDRKFGLRIKEHKKEVDSFTAGTQTPSLQGKAEQCNSQVSHHRPCRGREPCHRLGQGKSSRQRGTATDQMDKRGTLDQETPMCMVRDPTHSATHGTRWFPRHVCHRAVNNQDVIKMSDGHRNVVIR